MAFRLSWRPDARSTFWLWRWTSPLVMRRGIWRIIHKKQAIEVEWGKKPEGAGYLDWSFEGKNGSPWRSQNVATWVHISLSVHIHRNRNQDHFIVSQHKSHLITYTISLFYALFSNINFLHMLQHWPEFRRLAFSFFCSVAHIILRLVLSCFLQTITPFPSFLMCFQAFALLATSFSVSFNASCAASPTRAHAHELLVMPWHSDPYPSWSFPHSLSPRWAIPPEPQDTLSEDNLKGGYLLCIPNRDFPQHKLDPAAATGCLCPARLGGRTKGVLHMHAIWVQ